MILFVKSGSELALVTARNLLVDHNLCIRLLNIYSKLMKMFNQHCLYRLGHGEILDKMKEFCLRCIWMYLKCASSQQQVCSKYVPSTEGELKNPITLTFCKLDLKLFSHEFCVRFVAE